MEYSARGGQEYDEAGVGVAVPTSGADDTSNGTDVSKGTRRIRGGVCGWTDQSFCGTPPGHAGNSSEAPDAPGLNALKIPVDEHASTMPSSAFPCAALGRAFSRKRSSLPRALLREGPLEAESSLDLKGPAEIDMDEDADVDEGDVDIDTQSLDARSVDMRSLDNRSLDNRSVDTRSVDMRSLSMDTRSVDARSVEASAAQSETASTVSRAAFSLCDKGDLVDVGSVGTLLLPTADSAVGSDVNIGQLRDNQSIAFSAPDADEVDVDVEQSSPGVPAMNWTSRKSKDGAKSRLRAAFVRELLLSSISTEFVE